MVFASLFICCLFLGLSLGQPQAVPGPPPVPPPGGAPPPVGATGSGSQWGIAPCVPPPGNFSVYSFQVMGLNGTMTNLGEHRGKPMMIVNVATFCALTQQYLDFNPMLEKYRDKGFVIAAFPCNQFNMQEPGENHEILSSLKYVRPGHGWEPHQNLRLYGKLDVNGAYAHPLYNYLKASCPQTVEVIADKETAFWNPITARDITWNFEKFLIDVEGKPRFRFNPHAWQKGAIVEPMLQRIFLATAGGDQGQVAAGGPGKKEGPQLVSQQGGVSRTGGTRTVNSLNG